MNILLLFLVSNLDSTKLGAVCNQEQVKIAKVQYTKLPKHTLSGLIEQ